MITTKNGIEFEKTLNEILESIDEAERPTISELICVDNDSAFLVEAYDIDDNFEGCFSVYEKGNNFNVLPLGNNHYKMVFVKNGVEVGSGKDWKDIAGEIASHKMPTEAELKKSLTFSPYNKSKVYEDIEKDIKTGKLAVFEIANTELDKFKEVIEEHLECKIKNLKVELENKADSYPVMQEYSDEALISFTFEANKNLNEENLEYPIDNTMIYEVLQQAFSDELPYPLYALLQNNFYDVNGLIHLQIDAKIVDFEAFEKNGVVFIETEDSPTKHETSLEAR